MPASMHITANKTLALTPRSLSVSVEREVLTNCGNGQMWGHPLEGWLQEVVTEKLGRGRPMEGERKGRRGGGTAYGEESVTRPLSRLGCVEARNTEL